MTTFVTLNPDIEVRFPQKCKFCKDTIFAVGDCYVSKVDGLPICSSPVTYRHSPR